MILSNVIVDVTIPRCSFVFGQSRAKVSAGFTNVRSLAVAAFDLVYCSLSVLRFVFVLDITTVYKTRLIIFTTFLVRTITTRTLLDGTPTATLTLRRTSTLALLRQLLYRTSEVPLKLLHVYYNLRPGSNAEFHMCRT